MSPVILGTGGDVICVIISGGSNVHVFISLDVGHSAIVCTNSSLEGHVLCPVSMLAGNSVYHVNENSSGLFDVLKGVWSSLKSVIPIIYLKASNENQLKVSLCFILKRYNL